MVRCARLTYPSSTRCNISEHTSGDCCELVNSKFYDEIPTRTLRAECHRARRVRDPGRARSSSALDGLQYYALDALLLDDVLLERDSADILLVLQDRVLHEILADDVDDAGETQALGERVLRVRVRRVAALSLSLVAC